MPLPLETATAAAAADVKIALSVRGLQAGYAGGAPVLRGVNLDIRE